MATMADAEFEQRIAAVRRFNRFYTQRIGVLQEGWADSVFSLAEARVLFELGRREQPTAAMLTKELGLDAGYLSRILRSFETRGLIARKTSDDDGRQSLLSITKQGQNTFDPVIARTREHIAATLSRLSAAEQRRLIDAMHAIERLLDAKPEPKVPYILRPPVAGDMGWVIGRHGVLYAQEYNWDGSHEALAAEIVTKFIKTADPKRECCWIAERDGENVGSVFLIRQSARVAKLCVLLVVPQARGLGIGSRLVDECIRFARQAGYRKITLWTQSILHAAQHIYERAGFELIREEPHHSYGRDLVGETWELKL
jgi:DNA-binding MarR family transcriptional regulator/GNAT superfamily N-acetyltransferase